MTATKELHQRRSLRLKGYDYSLPGAYFITIVAYEMKPLFGSVINGTIRLSKLGQIVNDEWFRSLQIRNEIELYADEFVIMPNHVHGIVRIVDVTARNEKAGNKTSNVIETREINQNDIETDKFQRMPRSLSSFVAGYKAIVTSRSTKELEISRVWQRNYYDHIVRNEGELQRIWEYIDHNPERWGDDRFHQS